MKVMNEINLKELWKYFDFNYLYPNELNEKTSLRVRLKNHSDETNERIEYVDGYLLCEGWFDNMVEGVEGRRGITQLQYQFYFLDPVYIDGYSNRNNGGYIYFIPIKDSIIISNQERLIFKFEKDDKKAKLFINLKDPQYLF